MRCAIPLLLFLMLNGCVGSSSNDKPGDRPFELDLHHNWIGNAVCYGPHRDGQRPGGPDPSAAQIREDLLLMLADWNLLRNYGADQSAETVLEVIRTDSLDFRVLQGVWITADAPDANHDQIDRAIELANQYPNLVRAVCVGNETQVQWSAHRSSLDSLITYVRTVRAAIQQPVTVADDYNFWNKPESIRLADELDFLTVHAHPLWNGKQLEESLAWLQATLAEVQALHPGRKLVLGETGWATSVHTEGEQAKLCTGTVGSAEQKILFQQVRAWADSTRQPVFWFEAFDEKWKGGPNAAEVEKHWGVYRSDRTRKWH